MSAPFSNFNEQTVNWRQTLLENQRRSRWVIVFFLTTYILVGALVDCVFLAYAHPDVPLKIILEAMVTGQVVPFATLILAAIGVISVGVTFLFHDSIMLMGVDAREITEQSTQPGDVQLYHTIEEMKIAAGLRYMPKVYVIEADYMNAFASGYSERSALVAITRGLLEKLNRDEIQAVMAHELSHIRHLDIKLTLMVSVLSNLMLLVLDVLLRGFYWGGMVSGGRGRSDDERDNKGASALMILAIVVMVLRFVLPLLNVLLIFYLSRKREFMADAGAVELMRDSKPMASALLKISADYQQNQATYAAGEQPAHEDLRRNAYLFDPTQANLYGGSFNWFSTHPSIDERLSALGFRKKQN